MHGYCLPSPAQLAPWPLLILLFSILQAFLLSCFLFLIILFSHSPEGCGVLIGGSVGVGRRSQAAPAVVTEQGRGSWVSGLLSEYEGLYTGGAAAGG